MLFFIFPDAKRRRLDSDKGHSSPPGSPPSHDAVHTHSSDSSPEKLHDDSNKPKDYSRRDTTSPASVSSKNDSDHSNSACASPPPTSSGSTGAAAKRPGIDILARVFPHMKRGVLQLILQGCNGDTVQAIEQVLNNHCNGNQAAAASGALGVTHRPYLSTPSVMNGVNSGLKSAFSPINSLGSQHMNPAMRYAYPNARGLALAMPYPPGFLPNLAQMSYNYSALSNAQKSGLHYGLCPCPYTPVSPTEKQSGV